MAASGGHQAQNKINLLRPKVKPKTQEVVMFGLGPTELVVIAAVAALLFGPTVIRRFTRSVTGAIIEGRRAVKEIQAEIKEEEEK